MKRLPAILGQYPNTNDEEHARAVVSGTSDITPVAAVAAKIQKIVALVLVAAADVAVTPKSDSTAIGGAMTLIKGVPLVLPFNPTGWFQTAAGAAFVLGLGGVVQVSGVVEYQLVTE